MNNEKNSEKNQKFDGGRPPVFGWASGWRTEFRCFFYDRGISFREKMYSHGRCPKCGVKHPGAGTIVNAREVPYRLRFVAPRWKFWVKPEKVYKKN